MKSGLSIAVLPVSLSFAIAGNPPANAESADAEVPCERRAAALVQGDLAPLEKLIGDDSGCLEAPTALTG